MNPNDDDYIQHLYKSLDQAEPPQHLDRQILKAAGDQPRSNRLGGFALAATVILGLGIGYGVLNDNTPEVTPTVTSPQTSVAEETSNGFSLPSQRQQRPQARAPETSIEFPKTPEPSGDIGTFQEVAPIESPRNVAVDYSGTDPYHDFGADDWLTQIASLWENGDFQQAREAFVRFRQRFPDHPFPQQFPVSEASLLIDADTP